MHSMFMMDDHYVLIKFQIFFDMTPVITQYAFDDVIKKRHPRFAITLSSKWQKYIRF